ETERLEKWCVQKSIDGPAYNRCRKTREPAHEEFACGIADALAGRGEAKVLLFIGAIEELIFVILVWYVIDMHALSYCAPELKIAQPFLFAQQPPAEALVPTDGLEDES